MRGGRLIITRDGGRGSSWVWNFGVVNIMREESAHWQARETSTTTFLMVRQRQRGRKLNIRTRAQLWLGSINHRTRCHRVLSPHPRFPGEVRKLFGYPPKSVNPWSIRVYRLYRREKNFSKCHYTGCVGRFWHF